MTDAQKAREHADPYSQRGNRWRPTIAAGGCGHQRRVIRPNNSPVREPIPVTSPSPTSNLTSPTGSQTENLITPARTLFQPFLPKSQPASQPKPLFPALLNSPSSRAALSVDIPAANAFCVGLQRFFNNERLADATICCGSQEFKVHAVVLSVHSDFFSKAFCGQWKESGDSKTIKLEDVDLEVVKAMIEFTYHFDYNSPDSGVARLLFEAKVYSIADRYLIPKLKDYSKIKFEKAIGSLVFSDRFSADLCAVISEVYFSTPESDRGLRDIVAKFCHQNLSKLEGNNSFHTSLSEIPGLAVDMVFFKQKSQHGDIVDVFNFEK